MSKECTLEERREIWQAHVANRLGVSEERVRALRAGLVEGVDWEKRGSRLYYSRAAVEKLTRALELPSIPRGLRMLEWPKEHRIVVAKFWANPGYVGGMVALAPEQKGERNELGVGFLPVPESGVMVRVRVKSSVNLVRGMVLRCFHVGGDLYECLDLPRRKGRW